MGCIIAIQKYSFPSLITGSDLFQPELFASRLFSSLGSLLVFTIATLFLATLYYFHGNLERIRSARGKQGLALLLFAGASVLLLFIEHLISILVLDSSISFEAYRVTTFTGYTVVGLLVIIIWFIVLVLILDKAFILLSRQLVRSLLYGLATISATMLVASLLPGHYGSWVVWIAMVLFLGGHLYMRYHHTGRIPFSRFIFLMLFISVFMVIRLQQYNRVNVEQQKEIELVKLSSEHDPVAEMLFIEMSMAIRNDSIFARYLDQPFIDIDQVINRLSRNYFSGYWTKYDLYIAVCLPDDSIYIEPPDDVYQHCYTFLRR